MGIGPFSQRGLDEAFGLAVGSWREGPGIAMAEAEFAAARIEGLRTVAPAVVGEYAPDGDAESTVVVDGGGEESGSRVASLIGVELGERDARVAVDTDVDVFPSRALAAMLTGGGDAVAGATKAAAFLDVEVQHVAGMRMLVAAHGRCRVEGGQSLEPVAPEDARDRGGGYSDTDGDLRAGPAPRRRNATTWAVTAGPSARGEQWGLELRSCNPAAPSA